MQELNSQLRVPFFYTVSHATYELVINEKASRVAVLVVGSVIKFTTIYIPPTTPGIRDTAYIMVQHRTFSPLKAEPTDMHTLPHSLRAKKLRMCGSSIYTSHHVVF
jgi:hypothetical protein